MGSDLSGLFLLFVFSLYLSGHRWFSSLVGLASKIVYVAAEIVYAIVSVSVNLFPILVKGVVKAIGLAFFVIFLSTVYLLSLVVPSIGKRATPVERWARGRLYPRYLVLRVRRSRNILVEIVADVDDRDLDFEEVGRYREALEEVKQGGKQRLERGETVLSLVLGLVLLGSQAAGVQVLQISVYGVSVSFLIEVWLFAIAASILYRVSVLELLSYPKDVEFRSVEEFDAALSYQKMVALTGFIQVLFLLMIFIWAVSNVRDDVVRRVLEEKYRRDIGVIEVLPFAFRELKKTKQGERV